MAEAAAGTGPRVAVELPSLLRSAADGEAVVFVRGSSFRECMEDLRRRRPLLDPHLFGDDGELRDHVNLFLNGENLRFLESWDVAVRDGDVITVLQAVSGG